MNAEFIEALRQIEREKEIPFAQLLQALEKGLANAYKKSVGTDDEVVLRVEQSTGGRGPFRIYRRMTVVEEVTNPHAEITVGDARTRIKSDAALGETVEELLGDRDMERMSGRIASQTAKQVLMQEIREAERNRVFDEYNDKVGEIMTGTISRREGRNVLVTLGRLDAVLPEKEQVPGENFRFNDRVKVFVLDVRKALKGSRGPQVLVSRTHPSLIRRLFELEVPEIHDGMVLIKSVAREPGQRSKIAVATKEERIDPVGSCVGHRGQRVQAVVDELRGEKIDIVRWSADIRQFITESLSPAKVSAVSIDEENKAAQVTVPDSFLSLAIGKEGQNVRLAARLTGWRIDIRSEGQVARGEVSAPRPAPARPAAPAPAPEPVAAAPAEPVVVSAPADEDGAEAPPITFLDADDDGSDAPPITFLGDDED
jgi:N utilization substance protein A